MTKQNSLTLSTSYYEKVSTRLNCHCYCCSYNRIYDPKHGQPAQGIGWLFPCNTNTQGFLFISTFRGIGHSLLIHLDFLAVPACSNWYSCNASANYRHQPIKGLLLVKNIIMNCKDVQAFLQFKFLY